MFFLKEALMSYINFAELKSRVSILDVILSYKLDLKPVNDQFRAACPSCNSEDARSLVVTPDKGVFYCHEAKIGGDCIALVAHFNGIRMKDAAELINNQFSEEEPEEKPKEQSNEKPQEEWVGLTYLKAEHELVQHLGFDADVCDQVGIGYAPKGMMRGLVAVPLRNPVGKLVGYIGITEAKLPTNWQL
jgi:DNA primase